MNKEERHQKMTEIAEPLLAFGAPYYEIRETAEKHGINAKYVSRFLKAKRHEGEIDFVNGWWINKGAVPPNFKAKARRPKPPPAPIDPENQVLIRRYDPFNRSESWLSPNSGSFTSFVRDKQHAGSIDRTLVDRTLREIKRTEKGPFVYAEVPA